MWVHTEGRGGEDCIKGLVSSVNHGFKIKMIMVVPRCERRRVQEVHFTTK